MAYDKSQLIESFMTYLESRKSDNYIPKPEYRVQLKGGVTIMFDVAVLDANDHIIEYYEIKTHGITSEDVKNGSSQYNGYKNILRKIGVLGAKNALGYLVTFDEKKSDFDVYLISKEIRKLSDFIDVVMQVIGSTSSRTNYYKGHGNIEYSLLPSLYREKATPAKEKDLYKEAIRRCPNEFAGFASTFQHLVKLQHYGIPTRLLDLTSNALIALYFAVEDVNLFEKDGIVYVFSLKNTDIKSYDSDAVSVVANLARVDTFSLPSEETAIKNFNKRSDTSYLLHEIRYEKPHFRALINPLDLSRTFCVNPKLDNARIRQQSGAFFLYGIGETKDTCSKLAEHPINIVINHKKKLRLKKELACLGITDAYVYPEIDHVMKDIKQNVLALITPQTKKK